MKEQCSILQEKGRISSQEKNQILTAAASIEESFFAKETLSKREESLAEDLKAYEAFGIAYDILKDTVYYDGEPVRAFIDFQNAVYPYAFQVGYFDDKAEGGLYLVVEKDSNGKAIGVTTMPEPIKEQIQEVYEAGALDDLEIEEVLESQKAAAYGKSWGKQGDEKNGYIVFDAATEIENQFMATDKFDAGELTESVSAWIAARQDKSMVSLLETESDGITNGWLCYPSENRYGWTMEKEKDCIKITLLPDVPKSIPGPTVIHYQTPLSPLKMRVFLNGKELPVEIERKVL